MGRHIKQWHVQLDYGITMAATLPRLSLNLDITLCRYSYDVDLSIMYDQSQRYEKLNVSVDGKPPPGH